MRSLYEFPLRVWLNRYSYFSTSTINTSLRTPFAGFVAALPFSVSIRAISTDSLEHSCQPGSEPVSNHPHRRAHRPNDHQRSQNISGKLQLRQQELLHQPRTKDHHVDDDDIDIDIDIRPVRCATLGTACLKRSMP